MLRRPARVALVTVGILIAGASAWAWAPREVLSVLPWTRSHVAPTALTGASFSVEVGAPRQPHAAAQLAARLDALGVAAFSRAARTGSARQVMAGPYASLDEAEALQRRLAVRFGRTRLFVDDSLRRAARNDAVAEHVGHPALVLVGAPGRVSLAFEMRSQPRRVVASRTDGTTLQVEIGPLDGRIEAQSWNAPAGVHLIRGVAVEEFESPAGPTYARATLIVPEFARANTRIEGRRVYIDLTWPETATAERGRRIEKSAATRSVAAAVVGAATPAGAREPELPPAVDVANLLDRCERVLPFVQSAAKTPSPEVLQALAPLVAELSAEADQAGIADLQAAMTAARQAIDPAFTGNRIVEAERAAAHVERMRK